MKYITSLILLSLVTSTKLSAASDQTHNDFFNALTTLCGQRFEGKMTFPSHGQDSFSGKLLVASIADCNETQIKIPFHVGEDRSRTWLISLTDDGLQLKHDHRHEDGTPDEINMYGGLAGNSGSTLSQSFAADEHTSDIIPAASTNVWTITLSENKTHLTYHLERHNAPRFTAELRRAVK